jgi:signal transduction histidine kinase
LRGKNVELAWFAFAVANVVAMVLWGRWETIPFHFIWVSLTLVYGFRVWRVAAMASVLAGVAVVTGILIVLDVRAGSQEWAEMTEVPLMSAMFLAMVWHARRRQQALQDVERLAEERASLLEQQQRFVHDASHELRTPVTIARGHLEMVRVGAERSPEIAVALDELSRMDRIIERLLLLAASDQPNFVVPTQIDVEAFLEDVFLRWAEVAPRAWRLGVLEAGMLQADRETIREALDALLENAVKYTELGAEIELASRAQGSTLVIDVRDAGQGIDEEATERIFARFGRADAARSRNSGGVGLGLAIVDAIAKAHGGTCSLRASTEGTTFSLALPGFTARAAETIRFAPADPELAVGADPA